MPLEELDEQLKQLAISAQRHPPLSVGRQLALTQLVNAILRSGKLCHDRKGPFYEDIYKEALQNLFLYICQEIEKYNPERGSLMIWVGMLLHRRFLKEAFSEAEGNQVKKSITASDWDNLLNNLALPEDTPLLSERLWECIESDPERVFRKECIKNHASANFQAIMLRRLAGDSWENISADLGIKVPTLSNFTQRCIKKFVPYFKEYLY